MDLALIGLPRSGTTTVFAALTRGHVEEGTVGVVKVPDPRLQRVAEIFRPRRVVPAEVRYTDLSGQLSDRGPGQGIGGRLLNELERMDALVLVVRAFESPAAPHPRGSIDPERDLRAIEEELALADLEIMERRLERLPRELKGARPPDRDRLAREEETLRRLKAGLEEGTPPREQPLAPEEERMLQGFQFLTSKPTVIAWNAGEEAAGKLADVESELAPAHDRPGRRCVALCAKLEQELAQMPETDEAEMRRALGLGGLGPDRAILRSYEALGLVTFITTAGDEVRAWPVPRGTPAVKAAGRVHSDMERGFIRAEVAPFDELDSHGSPAELRRLGLLRREGKGYEVRDGDVITFLFNV